MPQDPFDIQIEDDEPEALPTPTVVPPVPAPIPDEEWAASERSAGVAVPVVRPKTPPKVVRQRGEPVAPPVARQEYRNGTGERVAPHNIDAEQGLLASCLIDETGVVLADCIKAGMTGPCFYRPPHEYIFNAMLALRKDGAAVDEITVANHLKESKQLEQSGGHAYLYELMNRIQTTVGAKDWREIVIEKFHLRCLIRKSQWLVEQAHGAGRGSVSELVESAKAEFAHIEKAIFTDPEPPKSLMDFQLQEHNPNRLLGDDYIERGDIFTIPSETSVGKSSFIIQFAVSLALGRAFFGIQTAGKHRSLIIQAEDSDSYNAKVKESIFQGLALTPEEQAEVGRMVIIKRLRGASGSAFYAKIRTLAEAHRADFVWINPIGRFISGSLTKDEVASELFLQLEAANPNSQWATALVQHTGKPPKEDGKTDNTKSWDSAYKGFGSSVLANSPRAIILLEPRADVAEGREFFMKLVKNGLRAGCEERVEQGAGAVYKPTIRVALKHTDRKIKTPWGKDLPMYLWEASDQAPPVKQPGAGSVGRPRKVDDEDALDLVPALQSKALPSGVVIRLIMENVPCSESSAKLCLYRLKKANRIVNGPTGWYQVAPGEV